MSEQFQKAIRNADLISGVICGIFAAALLSYVGSVSKAGTIHAVLALIAVSSILCAYLSVARATVEPEWKASAIVGGGVISVVCLLVLSRLF